MADRKQLFTPAENMNEKEFKQVKDEEILSKFSHGMSIDALTKYISTLEGLKKKEARNKVEHVIYENCWQKNK